MAYQQPYGSAPYGGPPPGQPAYGAPPGGQPYGAPPGGQPYGAPQGGQPYGAPPGGQPQGPPPGGQPYGAPPGGQPYGAPPGGQPYGAPPTAQPYGGGPPGSGPPPGVDSTLYSWFVAVDQDNSGQINANELQQALVNGNWSHFNAETCRLMISMFDKDNNGTINVQEFGQLWQYIQQWKSSFDSFDRDRSGTISESELHQAFTTMGFRVSPQFVRLIVTKYDVAAKQSLRFSDFIQCCVMMRSLTDAFRARDTSMNGVIQINYEDFMSLAILNKP